MASCVQCKGWWNGNQRWETLLLPLSLVLTHYFSPPQKMASDHYNLSSKEFSLERVIAEGSFGIVRMCRRRANNELLAAKIPKNSICTPIEVWNLASYLIESQSKKSLLSIVCQQIMLYL